MYSSRLKNWPILTVLEPKFIWQIRMAAVYGNIGQEALIVTDNKMVYALGNNANRHCKTSDICNTIGPFIVEELCKKDIKTFAFGTDHVLALTEKGEVYSWGNNNYGQLGNGSYKSCSVPTLVDIVHDDHIVNIACGSNYSIALTSKGKVYSWGTIGSINVPKAAQINLPDHTNVTSIACGKTFYMVITDNGEIYIYDNTLGAIGYSSENTKFRKIETFVGLIIEKIVCGSSHAIALTTTGDLYAWGGNSYGQIGNGSNTHVNLPQKVEISEKVLDVAASYSYNISIAMTENGDIFIWGYCLKQSILYPTYIPLKCINEAFTFYAPSCATYEALISVDDVEPDLIDCYWTAFNDPTTSDLVIKVQKNPIYVHKAILKIRCPYLETKFEECWNENNESEIEVEEFSSNVYIAFLKYLYTNEIDLKDVKDVVELYNLANTYSEDNLKGTCMFTLKRRITPQNVIILYNEAIKCKAKEIEEYCFRFAMNYMPLLMQFPDITELDDDIFKAFITRAIQEGAFSFSSSSLFK